MITLSHTFSVIFVVVIGFCINIYYYYYIIIINIYYYYYYIIIIINIYYYYIIIVIVIVIILIGTFTLQQSQSRYSFYFFL